jgi:CO dehydrogenase/acetyl-CoA synthase delta subunit
MATTKKVKKVIEEVVKEKKLSESEMRQIEVKVLEIENAKLNAINNEQVLRNLALELEVMKNNIEKQKQKTQLAHTQYENTKKQYDVLLKEVSLRYNIIGEKFSYKQDGLIIEE